MLSVRLFKGVGFKWRNTMRFCLHSSWRVKKTREHKMEAPAAASDEGL